jgi:hypothetical protein
VAKIMLVSTGGAVSLGRLLHQVAGLLVIHCEIGQLQAPRVSWTWSIGPARHGHDRGHLQRLHGPREYPIG